MAASDRKSLQQTSRAKIRLSPLRIYRNTWFVGRNVTVLICAPSSLCQECNAMRRLVIPAPTAFYNGRVHSLFGCPVGFGSYCGKSIAPCAPHVDQASLANPVRSAAFIFAAPYYRLPIAADLPARYSFSAACQRSIKSIVNARPS